MTHRNRSEQPEFANPRRVVRGFARAAIALGVAAVLAGCSAIATEATPTPTPSAAGASASPGADTSGVPGSTVQPPSDRITTLVTIQRTGGIAGLSDVIELDSEGRWTHTAKGGTPRTGHLTSAQLDRLRVLAADPKLPAEAARPSDRPGCADGFDYLVVAKGVQVRYSDCAAGGDLPVAANAIFTFVTQVVGI